MSVLSNGEQERALGCLEAGQVTEAVLVLWVH